MFKYEDGYTSDETMSADMLIAEREQEYINSAIFLFFRGRVERMKVCLSQLGSVHILHLKIFYMVYYIYLALHRGQQIFSVT